MICPSCGTRNNYYHRFCYYCGARLTEKTPLENKQPFEENVFLADETSPPEDKIFTDIQSQADSSNIREPLSEEPYDFRDSSASAEPADDSKNNLIFDSFSDFKYEDSEFNLQDQLPLRRYHKSERDSDFLQRFIKAGISIVLIAFIAFLGYVGYDELIRKPKDREPVYKVIDLDYEVEETEIDGQTARRILILSEVGEQARLNDKNTAIINGQAEFILPDREFDLDDYEEIDGALQVALPLTVLADGYPNRQVEIEFEVPIQSAPLRFISPAEKETVVEGTSYQLILEVLPGSNVYVDGNNYSHILNEEGQLSLQLEILEQPETQYEIRVSSKGYAEAVENIIFRKKQMAFPLAVDQSIPIQADGEWVEVTGNTHPEAVLSTNLELREEVSPDPDTGDFKMYVKASAKGYTPFILTASLDGSEDSVLEMVIQRQVTELDYTSSAWAPEYGNMKQYPNLHNGIIFLFTGEIKEIQSTGTRTSLLVDVAKEGQPEQLIYVDYWGSLQLAPGQRIRIFGNRWGNKEGNPYILAPFIYK